VSRYFTIGGIRHVLLIAIAVGAFALIIASPAKDRIGNLSIVSDEDPCSRPMTGSEVSEPKDLRSINGVLDVDLTIRNSLASDGSMRYCYVTRDGSQSPTLRVSPGDLLILHLTNNLVESTTENAQKSLAGDFLSGPICTTKKRSADPCSSGAMTGLSTNLHFHGLTVPPVCHQDDVINTSIQPSDAPFEYRFRIPDDEAPGLYWYHPHVHGFSSAQVQGGASGALIVEGLERANPVTAGLPERVFVIRDQKVTTPDVQPTGPAIALPRVRLDRDGDVANNGTGGGLPARDLSINFVPVPYPNYPPASIVTKPNERQLWRVLNASAITYIDLQNIVGGEAQQLGVVAIDGAAINGNRPGAPRVSNFNHLLVPPGARAEFIVTGPALGVTGMFVSRAVDTGPGGENDPDRPLAVIHSAENAAEPTSILPATASQTPASKSPWIGDVAPTRTRKLYFSETVQDPSDPNSPTVFYMTVEGQTPTVFDPNATIPNITVTQGDVEDWIIENRTNELHDFHIHQTHFQLVEWSGSLVNESFLRDTVNVPYFNGTTQEFPSVRLRMDFRDENSVGTFVYHCHLLEHEDGGMMGTIRVVPRDRG
jgi:FtsP/CotA-like multicopper oxidase with cupredoxin domain